jgi:hypothetical protein
MAQFPMDDDFPYTVQPFKGLNCMFTKQKQKNPNTPMTVSNVQAHKKKK